MKGAVSPFSNLGGDHARRWAGDGSRQSEGAPWRRGRSRAEKGGPIWQGRNPSQLKKKKKSKRQKQRGKSRRSANLALPPRERQGSALAASCPSLRQQHAALEGEAPANSGSDARALREEGRQRGGKMALSILWLLPPPQTGRFLSQNNISKNVPLISSLNAPETCGTRPWRTPGRQR